MATILGTMTQDKKQDMKELCYQWEYLLLKLEYPTRRYAIDLLIALVFCYLRGQNIRMSGPDTPRTLGKRLDASTVTVAIIETVCNEDPQYTLSYPTLRGMGFDNLDNVTRLMTTDLESKWALEDEEQT